MTHDTQLPASSVVKANRSSCHRDSHDDLDLATDVRLLHNDVAWAKGAPADDAETAACCKHNTVCAAHATLVWHAHHAVALVMAALMPPPFLFNVTRSY
jgi:hypothetical protein